jgi:hypothetical protein
MKHQTRTEQLATLRRLLVDHFDEEELETLCFDLGVDYDSLPAEGKANKARELVAFLERRDRIPELIAKLKVERPVTAEVLTWDHLLPPSELSKISAGLSGRWRGAIVLGVAAGLLLIVVIAITLNNRTDGDSSADATAVATPEATLSSSPESTESAVAGNMRLTYRGLVQDAITGNAVKDAYIFIAFPNVEEAIPLTPIQTSDDGTFIFRLNLIREQLTGSVHVSAPDFQPYRRDFVFTQDNTEETIIVRLSPSGQSAAGGTAIPVEQATTAPVTETAAQDSPSGLQTTPTSAANTRPTSRPIIAFPPERQERFDPVPLGVSIGDDQGIISTLGAKVFDNESDREMILITGAQEPEQLIYQPGGFMASAGEEPLAQVARIAQEPAYAAVAWLTGERPVNPSTLEGFPILCATTPQLGMRVWKSGVGTGYTEGFIDALNVNTDNWEHLVRVVPLPDAEPGMEISGPGDGGAVWVDAASGRAVALHLSGERPGDVVEYALAQDINFLLQELDVRLPGCES